MRTWRHRGGWLLAAGLLACLPASALTNAEVAQLTFVEQSELPRLMADRVTYLPDGHVAVGGWFEWPNAPVVAVIPNDLAAMQIGTQAASPRFAVAPDGKSLAFWKRVRVGQQDRAELTIVRLDSQMVTTLGEPVAVSESMHLAWLPGDGPLVYATEDAPRGVGVLYALDLAGGKPRKLVELHEGQWKGLQTGAAPGRVTALWAGSTVAAYSVNCLPGDYVPPTPASLAAPAPDDSKRTLEVDPGGQLVLAVSDVEGVVVDREVRGAQWRPDGQAICYVKDKQLWIVGAAGTEPRLLATVADAGVFLRGCCWSPNGVNIAYWGGRRNQRPRLARLPGPGANHRLLRLSQGRAGEGREPRLGRRQVPEGRLRQRRRTGLEHAEGGVRGHADTANARGHSGRGDQQRRAGGHSGAPGGLDHPHPRRGRAHHDRRCRAGGRHLEPHQHPQVPAGTHRLAREDQIRRPTPESHCGEAVADAPRPVASWGLYGRLPSNDPRAVQRSLPSAAAFPVSSLVYAGTGVDFPTRFR